MNKHNSPADILRRYSTYDVLTSSPNETKHVLKQLVLALATSVEPDEPALAHSVRVINRVASDSGID